MDVLPYIEYNPANVDYARQNRSTPTKAEYILREEILKQRPLGYKFLRQKPIGSFIADFYCSKLLLVIEVDGSSHDDRESYDAIRDGLIHEKGIKLSDIIMMT